MRQDGPEYIGKNVLDKVDGICARKRTIGGDSHKEINMKMKKSIGVIS